MLPKLTKIMLKIRSIDRTLKIIKDEQRKHHAILVGMLAHADSIKDKVEIGGHP